MLIFCRARTSLIIVFAVLLSMLFMLSPVQANESSRVTDHEITQAVERNLLFSDKVPAHLIDIKTYDGVVTLSGSVNNIMAKEYATDIARMIKGVRSVVNSIQVKPVEIRDDEIEKNIENAWLFNPATESYEINADVSSGKAFLSGTVESFSEKELAEKVAKTVSGVIDVENGIKIEYVKDRNDFEIQNEIEGKLNFDPYIDDELIDVSCTSGNVELSGTVGSAFEKYRTYRRAWVAGVKTVDDDNLKVRKWADDPERKNTAYEYKSDPELKKAVKDALVYDSRLFSGNVTVDVINSTVTLSGTVPNLMAKQAAIEDAENTPGVFHVENSIKVRPSDSITDSQIREKVITSIKNNPYLERHEINVVVINRQVYLYGTVDSYFEANEAYNTAMSVIGVASVQNKLEVSTFTAWKSDSLIHDDIVDSFFWSQIVDSWNITVSVEDGTAELSGTVKDWTEFKAAVDLAFDAGARTVKTKLKIRDGLLFDGVYFRAEYHSNPWD